MPSDFQPIQPNPFAGAMSPSRGLSIIRRFTKEGQDPFWSTTYETREGGIEAPRHWSIAATDLFAEKILCASGVPQKNSDGTPQMHADGLPVLGKETSIRQVIHRVAGYWRFVAEQKKMFATQRDAISFYDEVVFMMLHLMVSPSLAAWVTTGREWAYGISDTQFVVPEADSNNFVFVDDPSVEVFARADKNKGPIRVPNSFMDAVLEDREWNLRTRTDGSITKTIQARELWDIIAESALETGGATLQFETTYNEWNGCAKSGRIPDVAQLNRAVLNVGAFFDPKIMVFDVDSFKHATRLWTMVLEASFSPDINQDFRSIGLGYTNLASGVLIAAGIPYESKEARAISAAITSIMTGESFAASAEIAKYAGSFPKFDLNRSDMLRIVRNHRRAAYNAPNEEYEKITIKPRGIDAQACPVYLLRASRGAWDRALELGEIYGYRHAETTRVRISEEIDTILGADSSGMDPVQSLVTLKKSASGEYVKVLNDSVVAALKALRYSSDKIEDIVSYVLGTRTLVGAPYLHHEFLTSKGFSPDDLAAIEKKLAGAFELASCLNPAVFGLTEEQLEEVALVVCGSASMCGAPHLKKEHYAVFDCAARAGKTSDRIIHHAGQIRMMAAAQPFLSGTISKIITMSNDVNKDGVSEAFGESWKMGLKSVAVRVQKETSVNVMPEPVRVAPEPVAMEPTIVIPEPEVLVPPQEPVVEFPPVPLFNPEPAQTMAEKIAAAPLAADPHARLYSAPISPAASLQFGMKRALPAKRSGITVEAMVGNQQVYLRTGEYPNGDLGEIFIDMYREGAAFRSVLNCFAISISMGLQHGVPLEKFVEKFTFTRFEPSGFTSHPNVKMCTSIVDYIFRVLAVEYLGRMDLAQVPPEGIERNRADKLHEISQAALHVGEQTAMIAGSPPCDTCGHATVQTDECFRCMNCGSSMGC